MFCFITNDHKTIIKCRWGSGAAIGSAVDSWQNLRGGLRGKDPKNFILFTSRGKANSLK